MQCFSRNIFAVYRTKQKASTCTHPNQSICFELTNLVMGTRKGQKVMNLYCLKLHYYHIKIMVFELLGCPVHTIPLGSKCYGTSTISSLDNGYVFGAAVSQACLPDLSPVAGSLVLPEDTATNDLVHRLAQLTE